MDLRKSVRDKIEQLGVIESSKFFNVSTGTISNWTTGKSAPSIDAAQSLIAETAIGGVAIQEEPDPIISWEGKSLMMLLPVYRTFNADTHYTLFANYAKYGPEKIGMEIRKGTVIHEARNILIHNWYNHTTIPTCLMVDDDMILPTGNPGHINGVYGGNLSHKAASQLAISRIMSHGHDKGIVGALYFGRHPKGRAQCSSGFTSDLENRKLHNGDYEGQGLKPENWVATGCLKIERWVIDKMKAAVDAGEFPDCKPKNGQWYGFFNPTQVGVGEDVSFGTRAAKLGIQSYVDCGLICLHEGSNYYGPKNTSS